jgi:hypothetical protein
MVAIPHKSPDGALQLRPVGACEWWGVRFRRLPPAVIDIALLQSGFFTSRIFHEGLVNALQCWKELAYSILCEI